MEEKCDISRSLSFLVANDQPLLLPLGSELLRTVFADCSSSRLITFAATPEDLTTAVSQSVGLRVPDAAAAAA